MANMNNTATIDVKVRGVEQLNQLENKLGTASKAFAGLKGAIAGLATAGFISSLYKMANDLTDMAAATGVSTEAILGFSKAVSANGGTVEGATNGIAKFVQTIESAAGGSKEAQDAFLKLGVSLNDLRNLSEEDLLKKSIEGFSNATSASERLSLAVQLFGKVARSWDMSKINEQLAQYIAKSKESASAVQAAGDASQNFSNAYKELSIQILAALEPISKLANYIMSNTKAIQEFIRVVVEIGTVILTFTALGKIVQWGAAAFTAFRVAGASLAAMFASTGGAVIGFSGILAGLLKNIPLIGAAMVAVSFLFGQFKQGLLEVFPSLRKDTDGRKENADAAGAQAGAQREVIDALGKEKEALNQILESYKRTNEAAMKKFQLETDSFTLGEKERLLREQLLSAEEAYNSQRIKLLDDIKAKQASSSESEKAMVPQIKAALESLTAEYEKHKKTIESETAARIKATEAKQLDLFNTKSLIDSQNKLQQIQDDIAKSTMTELEKKYYDISAAAKASAKSAIEAEEARRNQKMPIEEQQKYYEAAIQGNQDLMKASEEQYKNSRRFSTGWSQAFNEYVDNATNAAQQAQQIFRTMTQGMEDLLFNFIKTGKFQWSNFVQSMVDTLLRSQIQQLMANVMGGTAGGGGGGGGLLGGLGKLLGFANGGVIPTNGPVIVGERGPELLMGAAGMNVVPNNQLGTAGNNITYNISAVDVNSFKNMIAQDPTFLYAVTEQGRRRLPGGR